MGINYSFWFSSYFLVFPFPIQTKHIRIWRLELYPLIHGLGAHNLTDWDNQISAFEKHFDLLIMDLLFYETPQLQALSVLSFSKRLVLWREIPMAWGTTTDILTP